MKITFLNPPTNLSGGNRVVALYADLLTEMGHDVVVVAQKKTKPTVKSHLKALLKGKRLRKQPSASHFDNTKATLKTLGHLGPITSVDVPDADVVIGTWWETAFMAATFPASKGRKYYFVQHHEVHNTHGRHLAAGSYFLPMKKIAVSNWLREIMRDIYGDADVALVPNGVDTELFHAPVRDKNAQPTISMMYTITAAKAPELALAAVEIARQSIPNLKLEVFGARAPTPNLPLPEYATFHFAPAQDQIRTIYAATDAYLFSSRTEGFGLPILEAMACRCPVVATRAGCAPDVIEDGKNGFLSEIDDATQLAENLVKVLRMENKDWRAMSDNAFDTAQTHCWQDAAKAFEAAIRDA